MVDRVALIKGEDFDPFAVQISHSRIYGESLQDVIGLLIILLMMGFVLGYMSAIKVAEFRAKAMMIEQPRAESRSCGTQSVSLPRRSVATQSPCTYK